MSSSKNKVEISDEELDSLFKKKPKNSTARFVEQASAIPRSSSTSAKRNKSTKTISWVKFFPYPIAAIFLLVFAAILSNQSSDHNNLSIDSVQNSSVFEDFEILELEQNLTSASFISEIDAETIDTINLLIDYDYEI